MTDSFLKYIQRYHTQWNAKEQSVGQTVEEDLNQCVAKKMKKNTKWHSLKSKVKEPQTTVLDKKPMP